MNKSCPHLIVDGDTIGPTDALIDQDQPLGAVQPGALDTRVLTPFSPEQIPAHRDTPFVHFRGVQKHCE